MASNQTTAVVRGDLFAELVPVHPGKQPWEMTYDEYRKAFPAVRCWEKYDHNTRADMMASHRLGYRQKEQVGMYYYLHEHAPNLSADTHGNAVRMGRRHCVRAALAAGLPVPGWVVSECGLV